MCTLNQAIEHAANHDELDEKLKELFQISAQRKFVINQTDSLRAYMEASATYIARCEEAISQIANIVEESKNYLEAQKAEEFQAKPDIKLAFDNMMLRDLEIPKFGAKHA